MKDIPGQLTPEEREQAVTRAIPIAEENGGVVHNIATAVLVLTFSRGIWIVGPDSDVHMDIEVNAEYRKLTKPQERCPCGFMLITECEGAMLHGMPVPCPSGESRILASRIGRG